MDSSRPSSRERLSSLRGTLQSLEHCEDSDAVAFLRQLLVQRIAEIEAELDSLSADAMRAIETEKDHIF